MKKVRTLDFVEIKWVVSWNGAVQSRFEECGPRGRQLIGATLIVLTNPRHSRKYGLATVAVLEGYFSEEEVYKLLKN